MGWASWCNLMQGHRGPETGRVGASSYGGTYTRRSPRRESYMFALAKSGEITRQASWPAGALATAK